MNCLSRLFFTSINSSGSDARKMQRCAFAPSTAFTRGAPVKPHVAVQRRGHRMVTQAKVEFDMVGSSYANALVDLAQAKNALEAIHTDMDSLASVMKESADIKNFLSNPTLAETRKKDLVKRIAAESGFNQYTVNFLNLLIDQNRIDAISEICEAFESKYCQLTDTMVATLRSAVKLEQEQQFLIAKKLQELSGARNVKIVPVIDESLIAGFVVEWGASQIDLSVKGQLEKISAELTATARAM